MLLKLWRSLARLPVLVLLLLGLFFLTSCAQYEENPISNDFKSIAACLPGGCAQTKPDYRQLKLTSDGYKLNITNYKFASDGSIHMMGEVSGTCAQGLFERAVIRFKRNVTQGTSSSGEVNVLDVLNAQAGLSSWPFVSGSTTGVSCTNGKYIGLIDFGTVTNIYSGTVTAKIVGISATGVETINSNGGAININWQLTSSQ